MSGIDEPILKFYGILVYMVPLCGIFAAFHWIGEIDPELKEIYDNETLSKFEYNGKVQNVIGGMPEWTFATIIWLLLSCIFGVVATLFWTVDKEKYKQTGNGNRRYGNESESNMEPTSLYARKNGGNANTVNITRYDDDDDSDDEDSAL